MKNLRYLISALALILVLAMTLVGCKEPVEEPAVTTEETTEATTTEFVVEPEDPEANNLFKFGMLAVEQNGLYGYIGIDGKWVIEPQFDYAYDFYYNGYAWVELGTKWGIIDTRGEYVLLPQYDMPTPEGLKYEPDGLTFAGMGSKYGMINAEGEFVVYPQFEDVAYIEYADCVRVIVGGKYGLIQTTGAYIKGLVYDYIADEPDEYTGMLRVQYEGKWGFMDSALSERVSPIYDSIADEPNEYTGMLMVEYGGKFGFINATCEVKVQPEYDSIADETNYITGLLAVEKDNKLGFMNQSGVLVTDTVIVSIGGYVEDMDAYLTTVSYAENKYEYTLMNEAGSFICANYNTIETVPDATGYYRVTNRDDFDGTTYYGYIDNTGKVVCALKAYDSLYVDSEDGVITTIKYVDGKAFYGYIDIANGIFIDTKFEHPLNFVNGFAYAYNTEYGAYAVVNESGAAITDYIFVNAPVYSANGFAAVSEYDGFTETYKVGYIGTDGSWKFVFDDENDIIFGYNFSDAGVALVYLDDGSYSYINGDFQFITDKTYSSAQEFVDEYAVVVNYEGKAGLINKYGQEILPCEYYGVALAYDNDDFRGYAASMDSDGNNVLYALADGAITKSLPWDDKYTLESLNTSGVLVVSTQEETEYEIVTRYMLLKDSGEIILNTTYDYIYELEDNINLFVVVHNGNYGLINGEGKVVVDPEYNSVSLYEKMENGNLKIALGEVLYEDDSIVATEALLGVIDPNGKVIIEPKYSYMTSEKDGKIIVCVPMYHMETQSIVRYFGIIDPEGKVIIDTKYDHISISDEGVIYVSVAQYNYETQSFTTKHGILDMTGKEILAPIYDSAFIGSKYDSTELRYIVVQDENGATKLGLINAENKIVLDPIYDEITPVIDDLGGLALIRIDDLYGAIDATGEIKIQVKFHDIVTGFGENGRATVIKNGSYGVIGTDSAYIIVPQFSYISELYEDGYYLVEVGGRVIGVTNDKGVYVINPQFDVD